jgi:hypothetical protein
MFKQKAIAVLMGLFLPFMAMASLSTNDLPGDAQWYLYADLNAIKKAESGAVLYAWLEQEVFSEVKEETGLDIGKSINSVTAFANKEVGLIAVVDGKLSDDNKNQILALAAIGGGMEMFTSNGKTYYRVHDDHESNDDEIDANAVDDESDEANDAKEVDHVPHHKRSHGNGNHFDLDTEEAYFSFAIDGKILLTSTVATMEQLLADKGQIKNSKKSDGALFVMSADKSFVQAGMQPGEFKDNTDFDSNVIRNAKQVALLISDEKGQMAVEAKLVATEPAMAESLGNIVRGLISLQAFSDEIPPEVSAIITSTKVTVKGEILSIKTLFDPKIVVEMLNAAD